MKIIQSLPAFKRTIDALKRRRKTIGFIPTMGFLHEGHLSLVRRSKKENEITVVSIFVNPLQFGPFEDFKRYPRDLVRDRSLLEKERAELLFVPRAEDLYPADSQTSVSLKVITKPLCGISRPTHFNGVATVVMKLLNLARPDILYLGQKDYQQCRVIEQMIEDLNVPVTVRKVFTKRETDGLAMSSRNSLLSKPERAEASLIYNALQQCAQAVHSGERRAAKLKKDMKRVLTLASLGFLDYAEIVDAKTLADVVNLKKGDKVLAAVAVYFGETRLIDNILIKL